MKRREGCEHKRAVASSESCAALQSSEWAGPSHTMSPCEADAPLQLHGQAAHAKSKLPAEAGTFDRLVAEDTAFASKNDKPNVIDRRGLEGKHLKLTPSRLHGTSIPHCKGQTGAAQGSWPSTPTTFGKEKISARSYCASRVLLALLLDEAAAESSTLFNQEEHLDPVPG